MNNAAAAIAASQIPVRRIINFVRNIGQPPEPPDGNRTMRPLGQRLGGPGERQLAGVNGQPPQPPEGGAALRQTVTRPSEGEGRLAGVNGQPPQPPEGGAAAIENRATVTGDPELDLPDVPRGFPPEDRPDQLPHAPDAYGDNVGLNTIELQDGQTVEQAIERAKANFGGGDDLTGDPINDLARMRERLNGLPAESTAESSKFVPPSRDTFNLRPSTATESSLPTWTTTSEATASTVERMAPTSRNVTGFNETGLRTRPSRFNWNLERNLSSTPSRTSEGSLRSITSGSVTRSSESSWASQSSGRQYVTQSMRFRQGVNRRGLSRSVNGSDMEYREMNPLRTSMMNNVPGETVSGVSGGTSMATSASESIAGGVGEGASIGAEAGAAEAAGAAAGEAAGAEAGLGELADLALL